MATVAELETRLEALKAQRDNAVARVSCDGRTGEHRGTAEIARAIAELERELQMLQGKAPIRQIRVLHLEGLLIYDETDPKGTFTVRVRSAGARPVVEVLAAAEALVTKRSK